MSVAEEIWKDVPGYEDLYQVSNHGRVRSLDCITEIMSKWGRPCKRFHRGRVLRGKRLPNGYLCKMFRRGEKSHLIHRLVAEVFIPNPENLPEVNHKNGVRDNNVFTNLEWVTSSQNKKHSYDELERKQHSKTTPVMISKVPVKIHFPSELAAAKHLGVVAGSVRSALKRDHLCRGWAVQLAEAA